MMSGHPYRKELTERTFIFLCGTIGAGKSTLLEQLGKLFVNANPTLIKEYIDYDPEGDKQLNDYFRGNITCIDFQRYILQCYQKQIRESNSKLLIFERHPMENLIFASYSMSPEQLKGLWRMTKIMCEIEGIPMPWECAIQIFDADNKEVADRIYEISKDTYNILCHLEVSDSLQYYRLISRGRESDLKYVQELNQSYLHRINTIYNALSANHYQIRPAYFSMFYTRPNEIPPIVLIEDSTI